MAVWKKLLLLIIITQNINYNARASSINLTSFADIIEPLMPTVVNIYTVKYNMSGHKHGGALLPELLPLDQLDQYLSKFNLPISLTSFYQKASSLALGSGFIIDAAGYIVTNDHVIAGSDEIYVKLADNVQVIAQLIGTDPKTDLALLKIDLDHPLRAVKFADSSKIRVGDIVIAIGNPLGFGGTVTTGIISSKGRDLGLNQDELVDDFLQTDAAINTGNSGGPLFNIKGEVIGVNSAVPDINGGTNIGIGFAIPSDTVTHIMQQLREKGEVKRGKLDIGVQEVTPKLIEALSLPTRQGVLVASVKQGGTGDQAGLQLSDLITHFNDQPVTSSRKLQLFIADSNIGDEIKLSVIRQGEVIELKVKLCENINAQNINDQSVNIVKAPPTIKRAGISLTDLSQATREKFSFVSGDAGALITSIDRNLLSEATELMVGDLIISINQQEIKNIKEFDYIYQNLLKTEKNNVVLLVKRGDFTMFSTLPIRE